LVSKKGSLKVWGRAYINKMTNGRQFVPESAGGEGVGA